MLSLILFYLFIIIGAINLIHMGMYIVGANIHDIQTIRGKIKPAKRKTKQPRPLVSVIIPAYNEELGIERCLDSIRTNTYRKVEVIVHNDRSTDDTARIVRAYIKKYPHLNLRLVSRRKQVGKAHGVNYCAKKYAKGELVMTLDADCTIDKFALKKAVDYFDDPNVVGVASNVRITDGSTILGLLQKFEHMIGYRSKKFYSMTNCEFIVGGVASTYRREVLEQVRYYDTDTQTEDIGLSMKIVAMGNKRDRIVYAPDVVAYTGGVLTLGALMKQRYRWKLGMIQNLVKYRGLFGNLNSRYSKTMTLYRMPMAILGEILLILEPFILFYLVYVSFLYQTTGLFVGAYITITLYVLWNVWPDEHLSNKQKFTLSLYAPLMYFIFYIMNLVQIVAIARVLIRPGKIAGRGNIGSHWTPPARAVPAKA